MKKVKLLTLLVTMVVLVGCGTSKDTKETTLKDSEVKINDTIISLDSEVKDDYSDLLGKQKEVLESKSCLFDGLDKEYQYEKGTIITYPNGDKDKISSITVATKDAVLSKNIKVGDAADKITELYGEATNSGANIMTYEESTDANGISFFIEDNKIVSIEIYLIQ